MWILIYSFSDTYYVWAACEENRPFLSSKISHFQNEANCKTFLVKMSLIRVTIKNRFHTNGFALSSPWNRGLGQHGNGLLKPIHCFQLKLKKRTNKAKQSKISRPLYSSLCGDNLDQYNLLLPWLSGNISCGQDNKFCFAIKSGHVYDSKTISNFLQMKLIFTWRVWHLTFLFYFIFQKKWFNGCSHL